MRCRVLTCLALVGSVALTSCASSSSSRGNSFTARHRSGLPAADRFLAHYVTGDGRVIRHDQGGDIVSEGQAYGMLIAEIADRPSTVRTIWAWTSGHLLGRDGLIEYHASGSGRVEDSQAATDADVLAAYALLRYQGPHADSLHEAGSRLADAVLAHETTTVRGAPVPVAGPWALTTSPPTVNPSYLMPGVFTALARFTGDDRWQRAADTAVTLLAQLTGSGRTLPPDWAQLDGDRLVPVANPGDGTPVQYGLDAARLPIWFATACTPEAKRLAARWWDTLSVGDRTAALALSPTGTAINQADNPLPLLAGAAAAQAAGDAGASTSLRTRAMQQARKTPTYYGDAWLALGGALLDRILDPCKEAAGG
jgi:endoglucanase